MNKKIKLIVALSVLVFLVIIIFINLTLRRYEQEANMSRTVTAPPGDLSVARGSRENQAFRMEESTDPSPVVLEYEPRLPEGAPLVN